jgi:hypothetical protein
MLSTTSEYAIGAGVGNEVYYHDSLYTEGLPISSLVTREPTYCLRGNALLDLGTVSISCVVSSLKSLFSKNDR